MEDDYGMEFDEGSDVDNWETEQVFQDQVQEDRADQYDDDWDKDPDTPF